MKQVKTIKWKTKRVGWAMLISGIILMVTIGLLEEKYKDDHPKVIGVGFVDMLIVVGTVLLTLPNKIVIKSNNNPIPLDVEFPQVDETLASMRALVKMEKKRKKKEKKPTVEPAPPESGTFVVDLGENAPPIKE